MQSLLLPILLLAATNPAAFPPTASIELPAEFEHDRVWLVPEVGGVPMRFYTDTGGGFNAISQGTAETLGLALQEVPGDGGEPMKLAAFPAFDAGRSLPEAPAYFMGGRLAVAGDQMMRGMPGFLGARWFADGIWEFDYPAMRLRKLEALIEASAADRVPLGFQVNAQGKRSMHFPSMAITVDGESLDVLLDTGATATLTDASASVFELPAGTEIGTSFIETEVFERWVKRHSDWTVVDGGDQIGPRTARMIRVPQITVGPHTVGPVWFTERPPGAFRKYMAGMMDKPTWGALGGSGLKYFRMTVDYPAASAYFVPASR